MKDVEEIKYKRGQNKAGDNRSDPRRCGDLTDRRGDNVNVLSRREKEEREDEYKNQTAERL